MLIRLKCPVLKYVSNNFNSIIVNARFLFTLRFVFFYAISYLKVQTFNYPWTLEYILDYW